MVNSVSATKVSIPTQLVEQERILAIDLGQIPFIWWSCRFYRRCQLSIIAREKDTADWARCPKTGELKPEVIERAIATLRRFQEIATSLNVETIVAVATSAPCERLQW